MSFSSIGLVDLFDEDIPAAFLRQSLHMLFADYKRAHYLCETMFDRPEAHDALPIVRRGLIEQDWRGIAARFPEFRASPELNRTKGNFHTEVAAGRVVLTESVLENPKDMVRRAVFRSVHAAVHQLAMAFAEQNPPSPDGTIYGVLIHGPDPRNSARPGWVHVAFPASDWSRYVDRIDLFDRFRELAVELRGEKTETIATPAARLRRGVRRADQEAE